MITSKISLIFTISPNIFTPQGLRGQLPPDGLPPLRGGRRGSFGGSFHETGTRRGPGLPGKRVPDQTGLPV